MMVASKWWQVKAALATWRRMLVMPQLGQGREKVQKYFYRALCTVCN